MRSILACIIVCFFAAPLILSALLIPQDVPVPVIVAIVVLLLAAFLLERSSQRRSL